MAELRRVWPALAFAVLCAPVAASAQHDLAATDYGHWSADEWAEAIEPPPPGSRLRNERWSEDWSGVTGVPLKNMDLGAGWRLTLGGDARWKPEVQDGIRLGFSPVENDAWLLQRFLAHGDLRAGKRLRLFVELGAHDAIGREVKSSSDDNRLDLDQAFVDLNAEIGGARATLRIGRQEMALGSPRWVSLRDSANLRQRHDLAHLIVTKGPWRADIFTGRPTQDRVLIFDDRGDPAQEFGGARLQRKLGALTADLLYYDLAREKFPLIGMSASERRRSFGARIEGSLGGPYDIDAEVLVQSGHYGTQDVAAYGGAIDVGRSFAGAKLAPRIGARFTYGSGDDDFADAAQRTFAPPLPRGSWFIQTGPTSFSNMVEAAVTLDLTPSERLTFNLKFAEMWRAEAADFVYSGAPLPGSNLGDRYLGYSPTLVFVWRASRHLTIVGSADYVGLSEDMHAAGARDVAHVQTSFALRY